MQGGFQELLDEFLLEARERADEVETLLLRLPQADDETRRSALAQTKRELHTLKGNSGMMGFSDLQQIAHLMEDQVEAMDLDAPAIDEILQQLDHLRHGLEAIRSPAEESEDAPLAEPTGPTDSGDGERFVAKDIGGSVRVPFAKIDHLVDMQAETLIFRNRLADAVAKGLDQAKLMEGLDGDQRKQLVESWEEVSYARQAMEKTLGLLQEEVTELGMVPLQSLFRSLGRIVHDESNRSGKQVDFEVRGGDTPIDKTLIEAAGDALGHLVRNAVIHGVEPPEDRRLAGKPERGTVAVSATLETGEVRIDVSDDGGGIDVAALRSRATEVSPDLAGAASDLALLFEEGISTREGTDLGAGRGVGMSAVKKSVEAHGGRVKVDSRKGQGTTFTLLLPVTASILRSLLVTVDDEAYALPLTAVAESLLLDRRTCHEVHRSLVIQWRGDLIPLLDLGLAFGTASRIRDQGFVSILDVNGRRRGLVIDRLVGIRDIVVKSLDNLVGQPPGISGSTILGDGRVIMILDSASLVSLPPSSVTPVGTGDAPGTPGVPPTS